MSEPSERPKVHLDYASLDTIEALQEYIFHTDNPVFYTDSMIEIPRTAHAFVRPISDPYMRRSLRQSITDFVGRRYPTYPEVIRRALAMHEQQPRMIGMDLTENLNNHSVIELVRRFNEHIRQNVYYCEDMSSQDPYFLEWRNVDEEQKDEVRNLYEEMIQSFERIVQIVQTKISTPRDYEQTLRVFERAVAAYIFTLSTRVVSPIRANCLCTHSRWYHRQYSHLYALLTGEYEPGNNPTAEDVEDHYSVDSDQSDNIDPIFYHYFNITNKNAGLNQQPTKVFERDIHLKTGLFILICRYILQRFMNLCNPNK
jgi:hypothetical protein